MKKYLISILISFIFIFVVGFFTFFNMSYLDKIEEVSVKYGIDRATILAMIKTESGFRTEVESPKGAIGLMQVLPSTADWIVKKELKSWDDYNLKNANDNIEIGTMYLAYLKTRYRGNIDKTLASYNAGGTKVDDERWLTIKETQNYVYKVKKIRKVYKFLLLFRDSYIRLEKKINGEKNGN